MYLLFVSGRFWAEALCADTVRSNRIVSLLLGSLYTRAGTLDTMQLHIYEEIFFRAGGGFFTGWKGIAVGVGAVAAAAGLVGTGIAGSGNNTVILVKASSAFIGNGALRSLPRLTCFTVLALRAQAQLCTVSSNSDTRPAFCGRNWSHAAAQAVFTPY